MTILRGTSLQRRLVGMLLGLFSVMWVCGSVSAWFDAHHEVEEILDSHLAQAAALLAAQPLESPPANRVDTPILHRYAGKTALQVWNGEHLQLRSANAPLGAMAPRDRMGFHTVPIGQETWRVFVAEGLKPGIQVQVGQAVGARDDVLWAVFRSNLRPLLLMLPLLAVVLWWVVRRGLEPLHELGEALHIRQPEGLERISTKGMPQEMVPMVGALNALFERIQGLLASERRFTADAAHELRTPIAAIRAHAEVAMREEDISARTKSLARTLEGCDRASHLMAQLLMLSRLEAESATGHRPVEMATLARQVLAELAPCSLKQNQTLSLNTSGTWVLNGDSTLLAVLLNNLVTNAIRHAGNGASIQVSLWGNTKEEGGLQVEDNGPGMHPADILRLGERFFRPQSTQASGSGLGWSIAQRIAVAHGMHLQAGHAPMLGGLMVSLTKHRTK